MNRFEQIPTESAEHFPSFEEQFANKEEFEFLGGKVEFVDIKPEHPKNEVPVLFAPGWGSTPEAMKDAIRVMVERGRRVLCLSHATSGGDMGEMDPEIREKYPEAELRKALALNQLLTEKGIEKADVIAHSEGGINTAIAASVDSENFRNIIFMNVGGLIGKDKFPKLMGRFTLSSIKENLHFMRERDKTSQARLTRLSKEAAKYIGKNPIRAFKEAVSISETQIQDMLKALHEAGIGIAIMNGVHDPVFPMEKMQKIVKVDQLDGFLSVKGGHNEILVHPEQYIAAADILLDSLEKRKRVKPPPESQETV